MMSLSISLIISIGDDRETIGTMTIGITMFYFFSYGLSVSFENNIGTKERYDCNDIQRLENLLKKNGELVAKGVIKN